MLEGLCHLAFTRPTADLVFLRDVVFPLATYDGVERQVRPRRPREVSSTRCSERNLVVPLM